MLFPGSPATKQITPAGADLVITGYRRHSEAISCPDTTFVAGIYLPRQWLCTSLGSYAFYAPGTYNHHWRDIGSEKCDSNAFVTLAALVDTVVNVIDSTLTAVQESAGYLPMAGLQWSPVSLFLRATRQPHCAFLVAVMLLLLRPMAAAILPIRAQHGHLGHQ